MRSGPNRTWRIVAWTGALPALLVACFFYHPYAFAGPVLCPLALALGIPCPGCGLTRALCLLTHGDLSGALAFHPLAPAILAYFAFLWIYKTVEAWRGTPPRVPTTRIAGTALAVLMGFWILRLGFFFAHGGLDVMARENLLARLLRVLHLC